MEQIHISEPSSLVFVLASEVALRFLVYCCLAIDCDWRSEGGLTNHDWLLVGVANEALLRVGRGDITVAERGIETAHCQI